MNKVHADSHFFKGNTHEALKDYDEAIEEYDEAIKLNPKSENPYGFKGKVLCVNKRKYQEAIEAFNKAIEINPYNAELFFFKAYSLSCLGKPDEALKDYEETCKLNPGNFFAFYNRGVLLMKKGQKEEAKKMFEKSLEIRSNYSNSLLALGNHYPRASLDTLMNHIGTHDTVRAITRLGRGDIPRPENGRDRGILTDEQYQKGVELLKLASVLQFTLPGVPCVYYGDEVGLAGGEDPFNRACFPWAMVRSISEVTHQAISNSMLLPITIGTSVATT